MAVHAPITGALTRAPFVPVPPAAITRILSRFDRDQIAGFITIAIDLLDVADGDPDVESNGDELDCTGSAEEDTPLFAFGAGDGAAGDPDDAEDEDSDHCLAGDDGCAPFLRMGFVHWGSDWEDQGI